MARSMLKSSFYFMVLSTLAACATANPEPQEPPPAPAAPTEAAEAPAELPGSEGESTAGSEEPSAEPAPDPEPTSDPGPAPAPAPSASVCQLAAVTGPCKARFFRYHFDAAKGSCEQFVYGGCQGNGNNFETLAACEAACSP